jgi:hypothetical protein
MDRHDRIPYPEQEAELPAAAGSALGPTYAHRSQHHSVLFGNKKLTVPPPSIAAPGGGGMSGVDGQGVPTYVFRRQHFDTV